MHTPITPDQLRPVETVNDHVQRLKALAMIAHETDSSGARAKKVIQGALRDTVPQHLQEEVMHGLRSDKELMARFSSEPASPPTPKFKEQ